MNNLITAETNLHGHGHKVCVQDTVGVVPGRAKLHSQAITGDYHLHISQRRQSAELPAVMATIILTHGVEKFCAQVLVGSFLFEAVQETEIIPGSGVLQKADGSIVPWDARVYHDLELQLTFFRANGPLLPVEWGLSNLCMDQAAKAMISSFPGHGLYWMPSADATALYHDHMFVPQLLPWLPAALHGRLLSCICVEGHWILMDIHVVQDSLRVHFWDGWNQSLPHDISVFLQFLRTRLAISSVTAEVKLMEEQMLPFTCGAIALLHLGHILKSWQNQDKPDEWTLYCRMKALEDGYGFLWGTGPSDLSADEREVVWNLREILQTKGVPEDCTEERARMALSKIGLTKLQEAVSSRNPWASLKALGSAPKINYLWVKPAELECQIRKRAQSKFQVAPSARRSAKPKSQPLIDIVDPNDLTMIQGTFACDEEAVQQLPFSQVGSNRTGLAFATVAQAAPFLGGTESLTVGGMAILTTTPVAPKDQGLLPVSNLRFAAMFGPTNEPILIDGSLIQLGDRTICKVEDKEKLELSTVPTTVLRLTIFKDQWPDSWDTFCEAPVKALIARFQILAYCRGRKCGDGCKKYHPPVDAEFDSVIADVWNRSWMSFRGKRMTPKEADLFQVSFRVPDICANGIHWLSGAHGLYVEPRSEDGKTSDSNMVVVWLEGADLNEALHRQRTTDKTLPITRFGHKYGIRAFKKDAETIQTKLGVVESDPHITVQQIYEMRPFPHGTHRKAIQALLQTWGWAAKPIQPGKADSTGMSWKVGAEIPPPDQLLQTSKGYVTVTLQKQVASEGYGAKVSSSIKTQAHIRQHSKERRSQNKENQPPNSSAAAASTEDPWWGKRKDDPWGSYQPISTDVPMTVTPKLDSIETRLQQSLTSNKEATEARLQKMETDIHEMKHQHGQYQQWFQEAGQANAHLQSQVLSLATQVQENKNEVSAMGSEIKAGFANLEAMLAKKSRTE